MSATNTSVRRPEKLSRRDFVVLPLLSLLTVLVMFGASEVVARFIWPENESDSCLVHTTPMAGDRYKANCDSTVKLAEGPWAKNSYNECGYRSAASCSVKRPGTIRVVILGTSFAEGFMVPYEQTFAVLTEKELTRQCGRPVEFQNVSAPSLRVWQVTGRAEEALSLQPDVVAIILGPNDISWDLGAGVPGVTQKGALSSPAPSERPTLAEFVPFVLRHSRALFMMRHFMYQDPATYLSIFLRSHGDSADYLRPPYSALWQRRMASTDRLLGEMAAKFRSRDIPVLLSTALFYPQIALLNSREPIAGTDAHAFEQALAAIAAKHDITFVPTIDAFAHQGHSEECFYTANGHMAAQGQSIYARSLVQQIAEKRLLEPFGCAASLTNGNPPAKGSRSTLQGNHR